MLNCKLFLAGKVWGWQCDPCPAAVTEQHSITHSVSVIKYIQHEIETGKVKITLC